MKLEITSAPLGQVRWPATATATALACLAISVLGLAVLSLWFPYGVEMEAAPWAGYIAVAGVAGAAFLWMVGTLQNHMDTKRLALIIFLIGLALRLAMLASAPVFEDDWYRYLWDGASVANGINPYAYPPASAAPFDVFGDPRPIASDPDLAVLQSMAASAPDVHGRINFPYLSTIYPPLAQGAFAFAYQLSPFSLTAWRGVLLLSDFLAFAILLQLLRQVGRPAIWSAVYWLNPLVIVQVFGAGHMDGLLGPALLGALSLALAQRPALAGAALAAAVGIKLWPLLLFPALAMRFWRHWPALLRLGLVFAALVAILLLPQALRAIQPSDGLGAYSSSWQTHAFLFPLIRDGLFGLFESGDTLARLVVAGLVSATALATALSPSLKTGQGLAGAWLLTIGALIFLSPTGYPWYVVWAAPLLSLVANRGLLILSITWPFYHLRFVMGDQDAVYLWMIVPLAFLPALYLFLRDGRRFWSTP